MRFHDSMVGIYNVGGLSKIQFGVVAVMIDCLSLSRSILRFASVSHLGTRASAVAIHEWILRETV